MLHRILFIFRQLKCHLFHSLYPLCTLWCILFCMSFDKKSLLANRSTTLSLHTYQAAVLVNQVFFSYRRNLACRQFRFTVLLRVFCRRKSIFLQFFVTSLRLRSKQKCSLEDQIELLFDPTIRMQYASSTLYIQCRKNLLCAAGSSAICHTQKGLSTNLDALNCRHT